MKEQKTILIAEVDRAVGSEVKQYFEAHDYLVFPILKTGEDLLEQAKALRPYLIITDTRLDGYIDGIEAIARLEHELSIPYIFITSFDDDIRLIKSYYLQPLCLIRKPINLVNLSASLDKLNMNLEMA